jgi:hypothetical protein
MHRIAEVRHFRAVLFLQAPQRVASRLDHFIEE